MSPVFTPFPSPPNSSLSLPLLKFLISLFFNYTCYTYECIFL